jgi:hypothetical protein
MPFCFDCFLELGSLRKTLEKNDIAVDDVVEEREQRRRTAQSCGMMQQCISLSPFTVEKSRMPGGAG